MKPKYHLTFDIDWAPDASIEICLSLLDKYDVKATFFATHETDLNKEIIACGHELGIHPNFLPGSSHGSEIEEVIESCLAFSPYARAMRTHALVQSSPMLWKIFKTFPQLKLELSLLTHRARFVERFGWAFEGVKFQRINYNWEDDAEFENLTFDWQTAQFFGDVTIFDFHPIHIHLNSANNHNYNLLKSSLNGSHLSLLKRERVDKFSNNQCGANTFLSAILKSDAQVISLEEIS